MASIVYFDYKKVAKHFKHPSMPNKIISLTHYNDIKFMCANTNFDVMIGEISTDEKAIFMEYHSIIEEEYNQLEDHFGSINWFDFYSEFKDEKGFSIFDYYDIKEIIRKKDRMMIVIRDEIYEKL